MANALEIRAPSVPEWTPPERVTPERVGDVVCAFLDTAATAYGRATHYNTRAEQEAAEQAAHQSMLELDRSLYTALLTLPGLTDRSRQLGARNLLGTQRNCAPAILTQEQEQQVLYALVQSLPATRMLRLFGSFLPVREGRGVVSKGINTNRTRKLVLRSVLQSRRLDLWAVKYRDKLERALTHAWGERKTGILRSILAKAPGSRNAKDTAILSQEVLAWAPRAPATWLYECVEFALGVARCRVSERKTFTVDLFQKFEAAKTDLEAGAGLPMEVLEGIRSSYHPALPKERVLELSKYTMTSAQRMQSQRRAQEAGVDVEVDWTKFDPVRLYLYAYEMGMNDEIAQAIWDKSKAAAQAFPFRYGKLGILVDGSRSMYGDETQKLRPMATALALRDVLYHTAEHVNMRNTGGLIIDEPYPTFIEPAGDTQLASHLVLLIKEKPDAIYVISDGYENAPAGRFADVVGHLERVGIRVPIYHLNPVMAAESQGVRELAPGKTPTMPVQNPGSLGISLLRGVLEAEPIRGINSLLRLVIKPETEALT